MSIITRMLKQDAVYWPPLGVDAFGKPSLDTPIQIRCRWEDSVEESITPEPEIGFSMATVYVDRDLEVGGKLSLGELVSSSSPSDAWEIVQVEKLPNLRATEYLRTVYTRHPRGN